MSKYLHHRLYRLTLHWWSFFKATCYIFYFAVLQLYIPSEGSFRHFAVYLLVYSVGIALVELNLYSLRLFVRKKLYIKAIWITCASYVILAIAAYYVLHTGDNFIRAELMGKASRLSWLLFLQNFTLFYLSFFKYAVILFLTKQLFLLLRVISVRNGADTAKRQERKAELALLSTPDRNVGKALDSTGHRDLVHDDPTSTCITVRYILPIKLGVTTYMLQILAIVFLKVLDECTTVYLNNNTFIEVKISLSKFCEWLPDDRFLRIHHSMVVAIPYIVKEDKNLLYMEGYEDVGLPLAKSGKYHEKYKAWKDSISPE